MGVREAINRKPYPVVGAVALLMAALGVMLIARMRKPTLPAQPTVAYFSDDDGQSYFTDSADKVAPFDRGGKTAVAAHVYAGRDGRRFVGYLEQAISPEARAIVEKARQELRERALHDAVPQPDPELTELIRQNTEVKKPGVTQWIPSTSAAVADVLAVKCPDGSDATPVNP